MANAFSKEERVAFEDLLEGFNDALVLSRNVSIYRTEGQMMERARNTIWRPQPYIATSISSTPGTSIASDYQDFTQLAVPATLGFSKTVPWTMTTLELRDALQEGRLGDAAKQRLASDINVAIMNVAANQGTLVVPINGAAGDYDDVALCDSIMNEQGVPTENRYMALSSRDYNGLAGNLAVATRSFGNNKSDKAYERSYVGMVAGFETYKLDYANRIAATTATVTIATNGAQVRYVPAATSTSVGGQINVDNRYQQVTVSTTTGVVAGAAFTIAGIEADLPCDLGRQRHHDDDQPPDDRRELVPDGRRASVQEHQRGQHLRHRVDHLAEHRRCSDQRVLAARRSGTPAGPLRRPDRCRHRSDARQHRPGHRTGDAEVLRHRQHDDQVSSGHAVRCGEQAAGNERHPAVQSGSLITEVVV